MIEYIPLTANVDGKILLDNADNTKARIEVELHGNYFSGNFGAVDNILIVDYTIEASNGSTEQGVVEVPTSAFSGNTYKLNFAIDDLDYRNSYVVHVGALDKTGNKLIVSTKRLQAIPIFDWGENDFNFNVPITIKGQPLVDYVIEEGNSMGWYYRKWASGNSECWAHPTVNINPTNTWGYLTYASGGGYAFPSDLFIDAPYMLVTPTDVSGATWATCRIPTKDETKEIYVISAESFPNSRNVIINIYCKGRWK